MKRLEEIQNEYARKLGFKDWEYLIAETSLRKGSVIGKITQIEDYHNQITEIYAHEVAQASLQKAAENAEMGWVKCDDCNCHTDYVCPENIGINKKSITNEQNITLL